MDYTTNSIPMCLWTDFQHVEINTREHFAHQFETYARLKASLQPTKLIMCLFDEIVEFVCSKTNISKIKIQHALMDSCTSRKTFSIWSFLIKDVTKETLNVLATKANLCRFDLLYSFIHVENWICGAIDFRGAEKSKDIAKDILETEHVFEMFSANAMTRYSNKMSMKNIQ